MSDSAPLPRLTIELVPKTCWYSNVRSNVPRNHWDIIRKEVYAEANYVCEICGGVGRNHPVECHEVWHYDDVNHIQSLERMIALCPSCHGVKHIGRAHANGYFISAVRHLASVNNWDTATAISYFQYQMEVWKKRSQYQWQLDISALQEYTRRGKLDTW